MHCDTISELYDRRKQGVQETIWENQLHLDLQKMKQGDYGLQNFALFTHLKETEHPFEHAMKLLDLFYEELEAYPDLIGIVTSYEEIEENWRKGRMSALLTIEEGGVCQGNISFLRNFYRLGVRMMTLTWNFPNELGYPNTIIWDGPDAGCRPDTVHGLTETGIAFVEEMERLGMIIDLSHLNDAGIHDVFCHTRKPLIASHSNARTLAGHPRNLTDEMIRELANRGGVAGINYCTDFLKDRNGEERRISLVTDMVAHMKHMRQIGGIGCIGLGSDFDGIRGELELKSAADLPLLEAEMHRQGFREAEIEAVFYGNVLRVYREILM